MKKSQNENDDLLKKAEKAVERKDVAAVKAQVKILGPRLVAECDALISDLSKSEKRSRSPKPELLRKIEKLKAQRSKLQRELREVLS